jgi:hypothetical protein
MNFNNKTNRQVAEELGHTNTALLDIYDKVKINSVHFKNDDVAELDIIYFLRNILWSNRFDLIAEIIKDYGMQERLVQWTEALNKLHPSTQSNNT